MEDVLDREETDSIPKDIGKLLDKLRKDGDANMSEKRLQTQSHRGNHSAYDGKLMKMAEGEHLDEFLNADALKGLEENNVLNDLNAMKTFNKGDLGSLRVRTKTPSSCRNGGSNEGRRATPGRFFFSETLNKTNQVLIK